jgi:isoleucyl-tRNA synthetase
MPFAQWNYPHSNKEIFDNYFPADFISEAIDQTRGWFYALMAISTLLFGKSSFRNCIVMGHVQDKDGMKLSKRLGNYIDPMELLGKYGADAVRWYFYYSSQPWLPNRFHEEILGEGQRKFMGTLWNTYAFYVLYANIDGFDAEKHALDAANLSVMDKWVLSRLNNLIKSVTGLLDEYKITESTRLLNEFVDELSNWYVRRCRERYWGSGIDKDKTDAYMTLYTVLVTVSKLCAPFTPFMAEAVYQNLVKGGMESVHLNDFPLCDETLIDDGLERDMGLVLQIVTLGRAARSAAVIKTRQPLARIMVQADGSLGGDFAAIVLEELNVKRIEPITDASAFTSYVFKPQLKTLGPKYGKLLGKISKHLSEVDGNGFMSLLRGGGASFDIDGTTVELTIDDVLYETKQTEGFSAASDRGVSVVLDTRLTAGLIEEGFVREIISKLQTMRKEAGFEVTDKIRVYYDTESQLTGVIEGNGEYIMKETLAEALTNSAPPDGAHRKEWDINGVKARLGVDKR